MILYVRGPVDDQCVAHLVPEGAERFRARQTPGCVPHKGRGRSSILLGDGAALEDIGQVRRASDSVGLSRISRARTSSCTLRGWD